MKILLFLLISINAYATTLNKINASNLQVHRYIIPQIRSLIKDFSSLENTIDLHSKYFHQLEEEMISIKNDLNQKKYSKLNEKNKKIQENIDNLNPISRKFIEVDKLSIQVSRHTASRIYLENCLSFNPDCIDIARIQYIDHLEKTLSYINTIRYFSYPDKFKNRFKIIWNEFIKKLNTLKDDKTNIIAIESSLVELNYSWHEFNKYMTINQKNIDKETAKYLVLIENRWKSILRTAL